MKPYSPFGKPIWDVDASDLVTLFEASEGWYIEYKSEMPAAVAIAKSLSAFANTYGGWLFIGIQEESKENPVAGAFPGLSINEVDATLQKIRKSAADHLNPSPHFETKALYGPNAKLRLGDDRAIVCLWVPRSVSAPHVHSSGRIYRRVADASEPKSENDRFVLDQLWRRADDVKRWSKEWCDRDPEFSESEKLIPHVRVMLIADPWGERDICIEAGLDEIRSILGSRDGDGALSFDTVHTTSDGFVGRQLRGNDPFNLSLTWILRRSLVSDIIIPLNFFQPKEPDDLLGELEGYENVDEFVRILKIYKSRNIRIVDLNYLFSVLIGIASIQKRLCNLANWKEAVFVKTKVLNAWRTIPFVDIPCVLEAYDKYGPPMCLETVAVHPRGTDPDTFMDLAMIEEVSQERDKVTWMACQMFMSPAMSFGIPFFESDTGVGLCGYVNSLSEAGRRSIETVQPLRNDRLRRAYP